MGTLETGTELAIESEHRRGKRTGGEKGVMSLGDRSYTKLEN